MCGVRRMCACHVHAWRFGRALPGCPGLVQGDASLLHQVLPDEMLMLIFARLPPSSLGAAGCVCKLWKRLLSTSTLWRTACTECFAHEFSPADLAGLVVAQFRWGRGRGADDLRARAFPSALDPTILVSILPAPGRRRRARLAAVP